LTLEACGSSLNKSARASSLWGHSL